MKQRAADVLGSFEISGTIVDITPHRVGHINDTFIASARMKSGDRRYTLQRINTAVFTRPERMMHNIRIVTEAIRGKNTQDGRDPDRCGLSLVKTAQGTPYHRDDHGDYWRCYRYIEGITYNQISCNRTGVMIAEEAASAFRRFQDYLIDTDANFLHVTIDDFHNTPERFRRLVAAVNDDPLSRVGEATREIETAITREGIADAITGPLGGGLIPIRVSHNDTKINNVVFEDADRTRPRALAVIDLDTVMPGSPLFDFGDLVRSSVCPRPEDETDLDTIFVDLGLFEAIVSGFAGAKDRQRKLLTRMERELLVTAGMVITLETGVRFLTDYLMGDVYFKVAGPRHNLDRARAQFRLMADMERKRNEMERIIRNVMGR